MRPARPAGQVPVHRLRANESEWTPPSVIFWDTETRWQVEGDREVHRLRLWTAVHVDRRSRRRPVPGPEWGWGETAASLADWVAGRMVGRDCVWMYAHNMGFDLSVSGLTEQLAARGWAVNDFAVTKGAPWVRFGKGRKTLTLLDSWSWLPERLESLATLIGRGKRPLPDNDGSVTDWVRRCGTDVDLLARSVLGLMDWWDRERLGHWTISGAGCGWSAMRHIHTPSRHVIDVTPELVAQDRQAVRGGRKDAAVVSAAGGGPWVEIDLQAAYPTVCRDLPCPVKRAWTFPSLPVDTGWIGNRHYGIIADCVIDTDRPRYPVRHRGVTWYPTGRFRTTLAGPELAWARDSGHLVEVGAGQAHRLGLTLRPWATWVLDPSRGGTVEVPAVAAVACRNWSRAVIGRWAARSHVAELRDGVAPAGWSQRDSWDGRVGRRASEVTMGGRAWYVTYDGDTENCYPAVLAWVESEVRVRLGKVLEHLDGAWWTCDTDGLLVDCEVLLGWCHTGWLKLGRQPRDGLSLAAAVCDQLAPLVAPLTIRPKKQIDSLAVLGPMHTVRDGKLRMAGVRADAVETAPGRFVARDWPGLKWQMERGRPGEYHRPERVSTFAGPLVHRWVCDDGSTLPATFRVGADGANELVGWSDTLGAGAARLPSGPQYRLLPRVG